MRAVYEQNQGTLKKNWEEFEGDTPNDVLDRTTRGILQTDPQWLGDVLTPDEITAVENYFGVSIEGGGELPEYPEAVLVSKSLGDRPGFNAIQDAIDGTNPVNEASGAEDGDLILVEEGTYEERPVIDDKTGLTVRGTDRSGVVIDARDDEQFTNPYGFAVEADGTTLESFTLKGPVQPTGDDSYPSSYFGLKISGCENFALTDITVEGSSLSEIDLNSVVGAELTNIIADGQNENAEVTSGTGVFLTNCEDVRLSGITTRNNDWGGIAVSAWPGDYPTPNPTAREIRLEGNNTIEDRPILYTEEQPKDGLYHTPDSRGNTINTDDDGEWDVRFPLNGPEIPDTQPHNVTTAQIDTGDDISGTLSYTVIYDRSEPAGPPQFAERYFIDYDEANLTADSLSNQDGYSDVFVTGLEVGTIIEPGSDPTLE
jgi:hypothetical protein